MGNTGRLGVLLFGDFNTRDPNQIDSTVDLINGLKQGGYQLQFLGGNRAHLAIGGRSKGEESVESSIDPVQA
jgi:hypothetical protein